MGYRSCRWSLSPRHVREAENGMGVLEGKIALVTAGGSGMGARSCVRMGQEGAHVIVSDLDETAAHATVKEIADGGGSAQAFGLDVCDLGALEAIAGQIAAEHGKLDVLFNHA